VNEDFDVNDDSNHTYESDSTDFVQGDYIEADGVDAALVEEINRDEIEAEVVEDSIDSVMVLAEHDNALVLPVWEPTGDHEVDTALEELATLDDLDIHEHTAVFTSVHGRLHQRLSDLSA
jgi:hypothetical protein